MKKVLVTGADGFIGSHLVERLVSDGYDVRAFAFYNSFNSLGWLDHIAPEILDGVEIVSGDVRDPNAVRQAVNGCDTVMHLAALIAIPFSYIAPDSYVDTNIKGTLNILQACREMDVGKIVHTSTSEVYGTAQFVPISEEHPLVGQSPYSATKIGADQLALSFHMSFGLPVSVIRPFNTYGPRQSARAVIPSVIIQLLDGATKIKLGAVTPTRDFSFVTDTVDGFISIARSEKAVGEVINVGSNFEISIADMVEVVSEITGRTVDIETDESRFRPADSEVERLWADISKADRLLEWSPAYGGIDGFRRGVAETIQWFDDPVNRASYKSGIYNL